MVRAIRFSAATILSKLKKAKSNGVRGEITMPKYGKDEKKKESSSEVDKLADSTKFSSSSSSSASDHHVDDSHFPGFPDSDELLSLSAEELQLQETLTAVFFDDRVSKNKEVPEVNTSDAKSSQTRPLCEICMEDKSKEEMFTIEGCSHSFCSDCISKHIAAKIQENINSVPCPALNCERVLQPEACRSLVPEEVFNRWMNAICESFILATQKFYCPFKDCSAMLVDDGEEVVRESECPSCRRLFCAQCKVPWHSEMSCEEFQNTNNHEREDVIAMELARNENWRRCPSCNFFVEKIDGCLHITCRCGFQFCYECGEAWSSRHGDSHDPTSILLQQLPHGESLLDADFGGMFIIERLFYRDSPRDIVPERLVHRHQTSILPLVFVAFVLLILYNFISPFL